MSKAEVVFKHVERATRVISSAAILAGAARVIREKFNKCSLFCKAKHIPNVKLKMIFSGLCRIKCRMDYYQAEVKLYETMRGSKVAIAAEILSAQEKLKVQKKKWDTAVKLTKVKIEKLKKEGKHTEASQIESILSQVSTSRTY